MTGNNHYIVNNIFKTDLLENVSIKQLKDVCVQYPFFSAAHYLLSKKMYSRNDEGFLNETGKTALYFTNPYWLQWLLENSPEEKLTEAGTIVPDEIKRIFPIHQEPLHVKISEETTVPVIPKETKDISRHEVLLFEPYHTIDYFASQGIKFIAEEQPDDKFGKQLKSFTEWLKTMKKLPQAKTNSSMESAEQKSIDGFAAHSIEQKEVLTETMAEVLAKQGKNEDAIGLYQKLSLINPSKSAYFAAKIEQLKSD